MSPEVEEYLERCLIELQTCAEAAVQLEIEALSFFQLEIEALESRRSATACTLSLSSF
jgi:hypothetical protein